MKCAVCGNTLIFKYDKSNVDNSVSEIYDCITCNKQISNNVKTIIDSLNLDKLIGMFIYSDDSNFISKWGRIIKVSITKEQPEDLVVDDYVNYGLIISAVFDEVLNIDFSTNPQKIAHAIINRKIMREPNV